MLTIVLDHMACTR